MTGAAACVAVLPLVSIPVPDAYQPARAIVVSVAALAACVASFGAPRNRITSLAVLIAVLLLGWITVSALAAEPASSLFGVHGRFQGLVSAFAVALAGITGALLGGRHVVVFTRILALTALIEFASIASQRLAGLPATGTFGNTVMAGAWMCVAASVLGAAFVTRKKGERWFLGAAAALSGFAVGMTGSRGAALGLACGLAVALLPLVALKPMRFRLGLVSVVAAVALALGVVAAGPGSSEKFSLQALDSGSAASRLAIWQGSVALIRDDPVWGSGPGRFIYEFPQRQPASYALHEGEDTRPDQAHSLALHLASESGIPALVLVLGLVAVTVNAAVKGISEKNGAVLVAMAGFAAYLGQGIFGVAAVESDALGWFLAGIVLAAAGVQPAGREAASAPGRLSIRVVPASAAAVALVVATLSLQYLRADASYGRFLALFQAGSFESAASEASKAVDIVPVQDVYRVAYSDAALYSGGRAIESARAVVASGLRLEPESYELRAAYARLLARQGAPAGEVANAYLDAVEAWPQGIDIRMQAADACRDAGMSSRAEALERDVALLVEAQQAGAK